MPDLIEDTPLPQQATGGSLPGQAMDAADTSVVPAQSPADVLRTANYGEKGAQQYTDLANAGQQSRTATPTPMGLAGLVGASPPAPSPSGGGFGPGEALKGLGDVLIGASTGDPQYGAKRQLLEAKQAMAQEDQQMQRDKAFRENASEFYDLQKKIFEAFPGRPDIAASELKKAAIDRGIPVSPQVLIAWNQREKDGDLPRGTIENIIKNPATPANVIARMWASAKGVEEAVHATELVEDATNKAKASAFAPAAAAAKASDSALEVAQKIRKLNQPPSEADLRTLDAQGYAAWQVPTPGVPGSLTWSSGPKDTAPKNAISLQARDASAAGEAAAKQAAKEKATTTAATRTMKEAAPKVRALIDETEKALAATTTGPFAGRWKEIMAGKVGEPDENFINLRTNAQLLATLMMRMHVGARGSEGMLAHFKDLFANAAQSPENFRTTLRVAKKYADIVDHTPVGGEVSTAEANTPDTAAAAPSNTISAADFLSQ